MMGQAVILRLLSSCEKFSRESVNPVTVHGLTIGVELADALFVHRCSRCGNWLIEDEVCGCLDDGVVYCEGRQPE